MNQEELSERHESGAEGALPTPRPGREARAFRKARIHTLIRVLVGNKGWRKAFLTEYPIFDNSEGAYLLMRATSGATDDPDLLKALEEWVPKILEKKPDWFVKQIPIEMP